MPVYFPNFDAATYLPPELASTTAVAMATFRFGSFAFCRMIGNLTWFPVDIWSQASLYAVALVPPLLPSVRTPKAVVIHVFSVKESAVYRVCLSETIQFGQGSIIQFHRTMPPMVACMVLVMEHPRCWANRRYVRLRPVSKADDCSQIAGVLHLSQCQSKGAMTETSRLWLLRRRTRGTCWGVSRLAARKFPLRKLRSHAYSQMPGAEGRWNRQLQSGNGERSAPANLLPVSGLCQKILYRLCGWTDSVRRIYLMRFLLSSHKLIRFIWQSTHDYFYRVQYFTQLIT